MLKQIVKFIIFFCLLLSGQILYRYSFGLDFNMEDIQYWIISYSIFSIVITLLDYIAAYKYRIKHPKSLISVGTNLNTKEIVDILKKNYNINLVEFTENSIKLKVKGDFIRSYGCKLHLKLISDELILIKHQNLLPSTIFDFGFNDKIILSIFNRLKSVSST